MESACSKIGDDLALPCMAIYGLPVPSRREAIAMIDRLDHLVLTTVDLDACIAFYTNGLGMRMESFGEGRSALVFGQQKINIHVKGHEFEPKAHTPVPGALDLCFIADRPLDEVIERLTQRGINIVEGPINRTGAVGAIRSVYVRDPDLNLIEISEYA
jgi:catechol 2,3-dioxygenase-like lactoylglutathione lyase family enzyme